MSVNREETKQMIDKITDQNAAEVHNFIGYINMKSEKDTLKNFEVAGKTSMDFWDNTVDDVV